MVSSNLRHKLAINSLPSVVCLSGEFWLGWDKIHRLSKSGQNVLIVDLMDFSGAERYAKYGTFRVADESNKYRLHINIGSYSDKFKSLSQ